MLLQERLDLTTLKEMERLAEEHEKRARTKDKDELQAEHWYLTAEWIRDLIAMTKR